ncbi:DUF1320 domain-containing protein [bacterium]|nr:DUF1320 domain-containing protein [bacterium]
MEYCTLNDLTRWIDPVELVALCSRESGATLASEEVAAVAAEVIRGAGAEIDSYLLGRYPGLREINPAPAGLVSLCARIAIYNLYLRRRVVSELWRKNYEDCRQRLEQASEGRLSLGLGQDGQVADSPERQWRTDTLDEERVYSPEKLDLF